MYDPKRRAGKPSFYSFRSRYTLPILAAAALLCMLVAHEVLLHTRHPVLKFGQGHVEDPKVKYADAKKLKSMSDEMVNCINTHQSKYDVTTWESAMSNDNFTAVKVAKAWWSNKTATVPMTVVTQLSFERLEQLIQQCKTWSGPISAVLYVDLPLERNQPDAPFDDPEETLKMAISRVGELHALMDSSLPCQLDLMLVYEYFSNDEASMLYPINVLRNYARLQARTPLVGLFDADMLVSRSLFEKLMDPDEVNRLIKASTQKEVLVIPGFITMPTSGLSREYIADQMSIVNKSVIELMYRNGVMTRFDPKDEGHNATNYERWFKAKQQYEVKYKYRYEPWVVAGRFDVPFYDVRFRGYGQNKIIHCEYMNSTGYKFIVDADTWLTHRAHPLTRAKLKHAKDATIVKAAAKWRDEWFNNVYGHTARLGNLTRQQMALRVYHPPLDLATEACKQILPWWKGHAIPM